MSHIVRGLLGAALVVALVAYLTGLSVAISSAATEVTLATLGVRLLHVDATGVHGLQVSEGENPGTLVLTSLLILTTFWLAWVTRDMARATRDMASATADQARHERELRREAAEPIIGWEVTNYSQDRLFMGDYPFTARMECTATNYGGPAVIGRIEVVDGHGRPMQPGRRLPTLGTYGLEVTMEVVSPPEGKWIEQRCKVVVVARPVQFPQWRTHETTLVVRGPDRLDSSGEVDAGVTETGMPPHQAKPEDEIELATLEPDHLKRR